MSWKQPALGLVGLAALGAVVWAYRSGQPVSQPALASTSADPATSLDAGAHAPATRPAARDASIPQQQSPCASVLAGAQPGMTYRYSLQTPRASQQLVLRLASRQPDGRGRIDAWHASLEAAGEPSLEDDLVRHCDGAGEADFWGPLGVAGITQVGEPTWRWPAHLREGQTFEGDVTTRIGGESGTSHRTHRVLKREPVSVPAGDFDGWQVEVVEQLASEADLAGTLWIAEGVGLLRSRREYLPGEEETVELLSMEQAS